MQMRRKNNGVRKLCSCPPELWETCSHAWHFNFKWQGTHYRMSLNNRNEALIKTHQEAEEAASRIRNEIISGNLSTLSNYGRQKGSIVKRRKTAWSLVFCVRGADGSSRQKWKTYHVDPTKTEEENDIIAQAKLRELIVAHHATLDTTPDLKLSRHEKRIFDDLLAEGYTVLRNGWPDFLAISPSRTAIRLIEVKGPTDKLRLDQIRLHDALSLLGIKVEVIRVVSHE